MRRSKKKSDKTAPETRLLSPDLTFLDVVRDACTRGGRFTLTADSDGATFVVLVDSGGPFNASGSGVTGSEALVAASRLTSGTYSVVDGWPVAQPLYQIGLDATLKILSQDIPETVGDLPAHRGVDALRNADAAPMMYYPPPQGPQPTAQPGDVWSAPEPGPAAEPLPTPFAPMSSVTPPQAPAPPPLFPPDGPPVAARAGGPCGDTHPRGGGPYDHRGAGDPGDPTGRRKPRRCGVTRAGRDASRVGRSIGTTLGGQYVDAGAKVG